MKDDWSVIGKIVSTQGLKGEVRVLSYSDFPERFEQPGTRWLQASETSPIPPKPIELVSGRVVPGKISLFVVRLAGIDTCEQAELLRGYLLLVESSDRPLLEANEYLITDLVGCDVIDQLTGKNLGTVFSIMSAGNDILEVKHENCKQTLLIPFVDAIAPIVDIEKKRIEVTPPGGLISQEWMESI